MGVKLMLFWHAVWSTNPGATKLDGSYFFSDCQGDIKHLKK